MKVAIFPGTFNPFHKGHAEIVKLGLNVFDKIVILFSINPDKPFSNRDKIIGRVESYYEDLIKAGRIEVINSTYLTATIAKDYNTVILKSLRNSTDFEYEQNLAKINRKLGVETFFVVTSGNLDYISSTMIRELQKHNVGIT